MENMKIYKALENTPQEACKPIAAGRLKGFTEINPMWRIRKLTEIFGICGVGWFYEIVDQNIVNAPNNEAKAFVTINLYYVDPETGVTSSPIPGMGGASFVTNEKNGPYVNDECFKMALTDAIGVACKSLGMSADIYFNKDRSKYTYPEQGTAKQTNGTTSNGPILKCADCGATITVAERDYSNKKYGRNLCRNCQQKVRGNNG